MFDEGVLRRIFGLMQEEVTGTEEVYIMTMFKL
jgi:hypothetical protein